MAEEPSAAVREILREMVRDVRWMRSVSVRCRFLRCQDVQRCDLTDLGIVHTVFLVSREVAEKCLCKEKHTTVCLLHLSSDLVGKHFALWLLLGDCDKMRVYWLV